MSDCASACSTGGVLFSCPLSPVVLLSLREASGDLALISWQRRKSGSVGQTRLCFYTSEQFSLKDHSIVNILLELLYNICQYTNILAKRKEKAAIQPRGYIQGSSRRASDKNVSI